MDIDAALEQLFSLGWAAAVKTAANDATAFERLKRDAEWHAEQVRAEVARLRTALDAGAAENGRLRKALEGARDKLENTKHWSGVEAVIANIDRVLGTDTAA